MKHVLLVDDEPLFLKSLAEGLSIYPSLQLSTAPNGKEAVRVLASRQVDLVVTDLQMPEMGGFELLAHLNRHFPKLPVMVITAFASHSIRERLQQFGRPTCLEKPLDLDDFAARVFEVLEHGDRGHVHGISIPSFLQLLQIERKTCQLEITSGGQHGRLYLKGGELIGAELGDLHGEAAAFIIIGWEDAAIEIENVCRLQERNVSMDLSFVIMESLRMADERRAARKASKREGAQSPDERPAPRPAHSSQTPVETSGAPLVPQETPVDELITVDEVTVVEDEPAVDLSTAMAGAAAAAGATAVVNEAVGGTDVTTEVGVGPTAKTLDKEKKMALESYLQSFRDIKGIKASAVMNFTGEVLASDSVEPGVDLGLVGATFNDIFRSSHEASKKIGLDACREMVIKTPKGLIVMQCSGVESKAHVHVMAVLTSDGNQALMKMRLDQCMPKIIQELS